MTTTGVQARHLFIMTMTMTMTMTMGMSKRWLDECAKRAQWIREGGLVLDDGYSQVDKRAHAVLADINALGFITADSQEGKGKNKGTRERAYVHGWLPKASLKRFLAALNQASGVVAWAYSPVGSYPSGANGVTSLPVTLDSNGEAVTRAHMLATAEEIAGQAKLAKLARFKGSIAMVECVDAVWGRLAFQPGGLFLAVRNALASLSDR